MESSPGILWTAMPMELVTEGLFPETTALVERMVEGRMVLVAPGADGMGTVERLLSTNPADYLDPRWQPGARISLAD